MPIIKYKNILEKLFMKPVFLIEDLHAEGVPKNYSKTLLHVLVKAGKIKHIERGKYTCLDDPITVASHITQPCYLSLWTALSIRNLTTQIPFSVEVVTSRKRFKKTIDFSGTKILFHTVSPRMMFGYENIVWKENIRIAVAKKEKIIIDALYTEKIPKEDIIELIKGADISLLKKYSKLTANKRIIKKINKLIREAKYRP